MSETPSTPVSDLESPAAVEDEVLETTEMNGHDSQDSDEDVQTKPARKHAAPVEDEAEDGDAAEGDDDLFGSESDGEGKR